MDRVGRKERAETNRKEERRDRRMSRRQEKGGAPIADETSSESETEDLSRTQKTRAASEVSRLGLQICSLRASDLDLLVLPERLRDEVDLWQRLKPRSRGRQSRLIAQLLRAEDHDEIRERVESLGFARRREIEREKVTDRWLARLLESGDPAVEDLMVEQPRADRQRLRLLTRIARQEPGAKKTRRARKELRLAIRELRDLV